MDEHRTAPRQPLLQDAVVAFRAPAQFWSRPDGRVLDPDAETVIDGAYLGDTRVVRELSICVDGHPGEPLMSNSSGASTVSFDALHRDFDDPRVADPGVRSRLTRTVSADGVHHRFEITSRHPTPVTARVRVELVPDLSELQHIKAGDAPGHAIAVTRLPDGAAWGGRGVEARLAAPAATLHIRSDDRRTRLTLDWTLALSAGVPAAVEFTLSARDAAAVVHPAPDPTPWNPPALSGVDDRLARWVTRAIDDLDALRLVSDRAPGEAFLAAGAPWFFTLFGRDSIWAARLLLPLGVGIAGSTLRALAAMQGSRAVLETAEQPGKIMHELRSATQTFAEGSAAVELPPLYYGTVDATPLWICLLAEASDAGLPEAEVRALLPHLQRALEWMRDFGDSDGDGLLEYVDETGRGLSNQGWKDSGDSVQWRDGRLAEGPIALCEVQAYAYQAAVLGADLLEHFGAGDPAEWRAWAARLAAAFRASFWIDDPSGAYPAIALDAGKHPVDTVTSNIGHLLGTGLLHADEAALVARRLVSPELSSGFGVRTMSTDARGYWPLSYHGGSVWTHDTAIAIAGLAAEGFADEAAALSEGLLRAAAAFDYRMPELHSGDALGDGTAPAPYPAACRPQAWSAAAAVTVLTTLR